MPNVNHTFESLLSTGDFRIYDAPSIQHLVQELEKYYKTDYEKPENMPYNETKAGQYPKTAAERVLADMLGTSHDTNECMRMQLKQDNDALCAKCVAR